MKKTNQFKRGRKNKVKRGKSTKKSSLGLNVGRFSQKRMLIFVLGFAVIGIIALKLTLAAPASLYFYNPSNTQIDHIIEQQTTWVTGSTNNPPVPNDQSQWRVNPSSDCTWDVDDHWKLFANSRSYLDPGASAEHSECLVAETDPVYAEHYGTQGWWSNAFRPIGMYVSAPSSKLNISMCYEPQGKCFPLTPRLVPGTKNYRYSGCIGIAYRNEPLDPAVVEIPGSNGGVGVKTTAKFKIANTTSARVRNIVASMELIPWGVQPDPTYYCDLAARPYQSDYPFKLSL